MQPRPPKEPVAWSRWVEQMLTQFDVDIKRLQITSPQVPDPEAGVGFTGPLDPRSFNTASQGATSGSPASGTRPASGPAASGTH